MDMVNNRTGYTFAGQNRAEDHNQEYFCYHMRKKTVRAQYIKNKSDPFRWRGAPFKLVYRALNNDNGGQVMFSGHDCALA
jgi:hypothetical protein